MCKYLLIYTRLFVVSKPLHTCQAKEENVLQIRGQICLTNMYVWFTFWGSNKTKCSGVQYKVLLCTKSSSPFKKNAPNDLFYVKKISQEKRLLEADKIDCCQYLLINGSLYSYLLSLYNPDVTLTRSQRVLNCSSVSCTFYSCLRSRWFIVGWCRVVVYITCRTTWCIEYVESYACCVIVLH